MLSDYEIKYGRWSGNKLSATLVRKTKMDTAALIETRGKTHGDYSDHAKITQDIKNIIHNFHKSDLASATCFCVYESLSSAQRESLDMIAHKIGRILAGDADFRDHWDDIAGYAKLVADRCSK